MRIYLIYCLLCLFTACSVAKSVNKPSESLTITFPKKQTSPKQTILQEIKPPAHKTEGTKLIWSQKASLQETSPSPKKKELEKGLKVDLEYTETDIASVVKQIMGDILNVNYAIHPQVRGVVNLKISGNYTKEALIDVLKETFNLLGVTILKKGDLYEILPARNTLPYSIGTKAISVYAYFPRFISPREAQMILSNFISTNGKVFVNDNKNYIIIADRAENIHALTNLLQALDVDILKNKEIRVFKLAYAEAKEVAKELNNFLKTMGFSLRDAKFGIIPIERLNYLILISASAEIMQQMESLVKLLDVAEKDARKKVYIYKVQYVKAKDLADTLIAFFSGKKKIAVSQKKKTKTRKITSSLLTTEVIIVPDETTNYLLIEATPDDYAKIMRLIETLDAMPRQVLIEVLIAEVSLNKDFEYGIEWWLQQHASKYEISSGIQYGLGANQGNLFGFTYYGANPDHFWNFLYFLATKSRLQVLSSPHITVRDNEKASINVGEEVPIATGETLGTVQTQGTSAIERRIQYKSVGVILEVTPHISEDGFVSLEISQEVSNAQQNTVSGIDSPIITTRKTKTTLMVQDGHAIVIGGIIEHERDKVHKKVPLLGDIPFLGKLFSYELTTEKNTELIVMLTPHVIRTPEDADLITNLFKAKVRALKKSGLIKDNSEK